MAQALEVEQIAGSSAGEGRFRLFVLEFGDMVVHASDLGERAAGYSEDELSRSLIGERGVPEHDAHLLIAGAKARFSSRQGAAG